MKAASTCGPRKPSVTFTGSWPVGPTGSIRSFIFQACSWPARQWEQAWKIKERIDPVGPTGHEPVKVTEGFLGPHIEAAFMRKSRGEFGNHEGRGNKKEQRRQHPEAE